MFAFVISVRYPIGMGPSLSNPFLSRELAAIDALLAVAHA